MARPPRRSDGDKQQRRRRLYILSNHNGCSGVSIYKLNEDDFDSDDAYSEDEDGDSGSISSSDSEGRVDHFAAQARFDSEYDVDSRARRLRHRRLVARLATEGCPEFVAAGTKIVGLEKGSFYRAAAFDNFTFDARSRLVSATPSLRSPKKYDAFWAIGGTVYALDTSADEPSHGKDQRCFFERLGPEPQRHWGTLQWEALPRPPFKLDHIVASRAVHPDGATVFLSVYKTGTFSFDAERLEWARHGDWVLPFDGEGYYARDLDAWVGLCERHRGRLAACRVVDDRRGGAEPACKCGKDLLFRHAWRRHDHASLVYMGDARFCLLETVKQPDEDRSCCSGGIEPMLLRVVTFRIHCSWDAELCLVNRRSKVYRLPWHSSSEKPRGFWI